MSIEGSGSTRAGSGPGYYDAAGHRYAEHRRADPRIAAHILGALSGAASVVNIGAGTGSYEPSDRRVVAAEPSLTMLRQRERATPCIRAVAESLPFPDECFDNALAVLTIHHWSDWRRGVSEMRRVARSVVILTFDTEATPAFWLFDYFPSMLEHDRARMPTVAALCEALGATVEPVPIPHDCTDGFLGAYWRHPERYLEPAVRSAMSAFAMLQQPELDEGLRRLRDDLDSGAWDDRYGSLLRAESLDLGYRLIRTRGHRVG